MTDYGVRMVIGGRPADGSLVIQSWAASTIVGGTAALVPPGSSRSEDVDYGRFGTLSRLEIQIAISARWWQWTAMAAACMTSFGQKHGRQIGRSASLGVTA
jgi:hypothetical protein